MTDLLPGMSEYDPPMVKAVKITLAAKRAAGLIKPEHEALCQLAIELATSIAAGAATGKTSTPQSAQQLLNTLEALPQMVEETPIDALAEAMRQ